MKKITKKGAAALAVLALLAAGSAAALAFQSGRPRGSRAEITYRGETVQTVDLSLDGVYRLEADPSIYYEVLDGGIRFIRADCPDKICEQAGLLTRVGETAVCLPRQTVITVTEGGAGEVDAVAG